MTEEKRVVGLDGLRALAIGLVLVDHVSGDRFAGGGIGVAIFFVLSGYLITSILAAEHGRTGSIGLRLFYARRALRLWPALLVMLGVTVALGASARSAAIAATYLTDVANIFGRGVYPYGHTWSLAVEEQFYLVWPLVLILLLKADLKVAGWLALALAGLSVVACATWTAVQIASTGTIGLGVFNPVLQGHGLLIGCALALLGGRWRLPRPRAVVLTATGAQVGVAILGSVLVGSHLAVLWNVSSELLTVLLIVGIRELTSGLYVLPPVVWLGRRSYAVYLWHLPLILIFGAMQLWHPTVLAIAATVVAAELSARFVEAPFLRWKARLHRDRAVARPEAASTPSSLDPT
jgi:peptidoglycan/LPS O-acetylase OafA/YrhL